MCRTVWCYAAISLLVAVTAMVFVLFHDRRPAENQRLFHMFGRQSFDVTHEFEYGGFQRSFAVDLPAIIDSDSPSPILLVIHGKSSSPDDAKFFIGPASSTRAAELGFIVVYANATHVAGGSPTWNAGACCSPATSLGIDDVGYFELVLAQVAREHRGDIGRVSLTGFSNGGMMTQRLACAWAGHDSITVRAIAPVISSAGHKRSDGAGASKCVAQRKKTVSFLGIVDVPFPGLYEFEHSTCPYEVFAALPSEHYSCAGLRDIPALIISGALDKLVPLNGGWMKDSLSPPVNYLVRLIGDANGCDGIVNVTTSFSRMLPTGDTEETTCTSTGSCRANTTWCTGMSNGHNWQIVDQIDPDSHVALLSPLLVWMLGPISHSFDTSAHILSFVAKYSGLHI